jgi:hypothetical protein
MGRAILYRNSIPACAFSIEVSKPQDKFVYYCSRKRCGAVLCALDRPTIVYAKFKCETCGHMTTWRLSVQSKDSRLSEARVGV